MNRAAFYASVRASLFGGSLSQPQVDGLTVLLDEADKRPDYDPRYLAYVLATALHETANTMQPVREIGRGKGKDYGVPGKNGKQVAYGRGFVQLTWDANYERADKKLGLNGALVKDYDLALRPDISAAILFRGMEEGWFTTHRLSDHITAAKTDFVNARRIVNGKDRAQLIAGHAERFLTAILAAELAPQEPVQPPDWVPPLPSGPAEPKKGWLAVLVDFILALFRSK